MVHTDCEIPHCHCTRAYVEGLRDNKAAVLKRLKEANLTQPQIDIIMEGVTVAEPNPSD